MSVHVVGLSGTLTEKLKDEGPAYVTGVDGCMDESKFTVLLDVLRVLEKNNTPEVRESIMQIIDHYDADMNIEQKAKVLKEFLGFKKREEERRKHFEEEQTKQKMQQFMKTFDYF